MTTNDAAIYVRISADPEGERAGVERQRRECEALADRLGLSVVAVLEDNDRSAYSGKPRPGFEQLMAGAGDDYAHVIAWSSDRLYRRMADLTRITDELAGAVQIHTVVGGDVDLTTSEGILRAQMLGSVAEFESRRKGERVAARAVQRAQSGQMTASTRPFGWRWRQPCPGGDECRHKTTCTGDGLRARVGSRSGVEIDPDESLLLIDAYQQIKAGASLRSVWVAMRGRGVERLSDPSSLRGVLLSARNAGRVAHRGRVVADAADGARIVDQDTFDTVAAILRDPGRRTSPGRPSNTLLGKSLFCGRCGASMAASKRDGRTPVYVCSRPDGHRKVVRDLIDVPVLDLVGEVLAALAERGMLTMPDPDGDEVVEQLRARAADIETKLDALAGLLNAGELDPIDYAAATRKLRANLTDVGERLTRRSGRPALAALSAGKGGVAAAWGQVVTDAREGRVDALRGVMAELLDGIDLHAGRRVVLRWQPWVGPAPAELMLDASPRINRDRRRAEVARLHAEGRSQRDIAQALQVAPSTVSKDLTAMQVAS